MSDPHQHFEIRTNTKGLAIPAAIMAGSRNPLEEPRFGDVFAFTTNWHESYDYRVMYVGPGGPHSDMWLGVRLPPRDDEYECTEHWPLRGTLWKYIGP